MDLTPARQEKIERLVRERQQGIIILEDITDPHNAAAVLRSCDSFGFPTVYFIFEKERKFNPETRGKLSSASANKWLEFKTFDSTEECLSELKGKFEIIATALTENSENLFTAKFTKPNIAVMFGNEHAGLSETALKMADRTVMIPMKGMVQSLNLSVTAGIFLAEISRQRTKSGQDYSLPAEKQAEILKQFLAE